MGGDRWIWGVYCSLIFISIIEIASASSRLAYREITNDNPLMRHTLFLIVGFFTFCVGLQSLTRANIKWAQWLGVIGYGGGVLLMALMPVIGRKVNGAARDIYGIQPVELCKVGMIIVLCLAIATKDEFYRKWPFFKKNIEVRRYYFLLILIGLAVVPIMIQNLSTAMILAFSALGIMFLGKVNGKYLLRTIGGAVALAICFLGILFALHTFNQSKEEAGQLHHTDLGVIDRANTWEKRIFDTNSIPLYEQKLNDANMQEMCAHMAIANSNGIGQFIGESQMRDYLPEAYSDYIYSIIFEETGILGAAIVMALYFILLWRCYKISLLTDDTFKRLLIIAIPLMIVIQALIHMGVCTDAMFVTGQPLPLISRGGMSSFATSACFGIMFGLSYDIMREYKNKNYMSNND